MFALPDLFTLGILTHQHFRGFGEWTERRREPPKARLGLAGGVPGFAARRIVEGAFLIIPVGAGLLVEYLHGANDLPVDIPQWFSLSFIVLIVFVSLLDARREAAHHPRHLECLTPERTARIFVDTDV